MALKTAVLLLSCALVVRADFSDLSSLHSELNSGVNDFCNQVIGQPCKPTPPPPTPESIPPAPPAPEPSAVTTAPTPSVPAPAPFTGAISPLAPGPAVLGSGSASIVLSLDLPPGFQLTQAVLDTLESILQANIGSLGRITLTIATSGRKLLVAAIVSATIEDVTDCDALIARLNNFVNSGDFVDEANKNGVPLLRANLPIGSCVGAGLSTVTNPTVPLAPAPLGRR